uniref:Uncharacterized protein n=1 Tax=Anguilla anguilla TaxID=7936 RepID=A0A0E9PF24_ANGAN
MRSITLTSVRSLRMRRASTGRLWEPCNPPGIQVILSPSYTPACIHKHAQTLLGMNAVFTV